MNSGRTFEETVARLLIAAGHRVTREHIVVYKKIDLYFEERRLGTERRIAVECKDYDRALSQSELNEIYVNYLPLYRDNIIDELLLVTRSGLAPSAQTMARSIRELVHLTLNELQRDIMDFESYLAGLVKQYEHGGLCSYYVPSTAEGGEDLQSLVTAWLLETDAQPLAILGSYGMGKSTFALHLCSVLARRALANMSERLPILIKLGEISSEQSLEGLLGKALTATSIVRGYTFPTFMELNAAGRFVIMLDGFDEMKHTLSRDEFRFNLKQLNRLTGAGTKTILLGRSTAFLTQEEQQRALHGVYQHRGVTFHEPDSPDYREVHMAPFSQDQVREFLTLYLDFKKGASESERAKTKIDSMISQIDKIFQREHLTDIAKRPVQLRMLADILPDWRADLSRLTVTILYSVFIDTVIEREQDKSARQRLDIKQRRSFAAAVAWWMWQSKKQASISAKDIPEMIIEPFCRPDDDSEAVRRDLVSACFLERKVGDILYFPHRSFQEFLVAEVMMEHLISGKLSLGEAKDLITTEVADFLCGAVDLGGVVDIKFMKACEVQLQNCHGQLPWNLVRVWMGGSKASDYLLGQLRASEVPWYPLFLAVGMVKGSLPLLPARVLKDELLSRISHSRDLLFRLVCFLAVMLILECLTDDWSRSVAGVSALIRLCQVFEIRLSKSARRATKKETKQHLQTQEKKQSPDQVIIKMMASLSFSRDPTTGDVDIEIADVYPILLGYIQSYCFLAEWSEEGVPLPNKLATRGFKDFSLIEEFRRMWCSNVVEKAVT